MIAAIRTAYGGQMFRSRLEAHWAAFFDALGWPWEYEPIDLRGYIPDFVLRLHRPVLVEVKPELEFAALEQHLAKIDSSGWDADLDAIVVGACLFEARGEVGPMGGEPLAMGLCRYTLGPALLMTCTACRRPSFIDAIGSWHCRVCGFQDGDRSQAPLGNALGVWRRTAAKVQWRAS